MTKIMPKKRKLETEVIIFIMLYSTLFLLIILEHNFLDIIYFITIAVYLVRLYLCRKRNNK